jgi:hemerythrin
MQWSKAYDTGVYQLDQLHRKLLSLLSELEIAVDLDAPNSEQQDILLELLGTLSDHIEIEASLGKRHRLSGMQEVSQEHQQQLWAMEALVEHPLDAVTLNKIGQILLDHILGDVNSFGKTLYRHGVR